MGSWDWPIAINTFVAIATAAGTFLATKGVEGWIKLRRDQHIDKEYEDRREAAGADLVITKWENRLNKVESQLEASRLEHMECVKNHSMMQGQLTQVMNELAHLRSEVIKKV